MKINKIYNDCEYFGICRAYNTKSVICRKYKLRCYQYRNKSGVYKMKHNKKYDISS